MENWNEAFAWCGLLCVVVVGAYFLSRVSGTKWREPFAWCSLLCVIVIGGYSYCMLVIRVAFAEEQVSMFYSFRENVRRGSTSPNAATISIEEYYPSGSKQIRGSSLDRLVESVRENVILELKELEAARSDSVTRD